MQSGDSFEFALRLCGQGAIWQDCAKYVVDREQGLLQFPAKVCPHQGIIVGLTCISSNKIGSYVNLGLHANMAQKITLHHCLTCHMPKQLRDWPLPSLLFSGG